MKLFAGLSLFLCMFGSNVMAAEQAHQYIYQALVSATEPSCEMAAAGLAQRFQAATGASVDAAICQGSVNVPADDTAYPMYSLALRYHADFAFNPHTVMVNGRDPYQVSSAANLYTAFNECLTDISAQVAIFEAQTGLSAVDASCVANNSLSPSYAIQIHGFSQEAYAKPLKQLFTFWANVSPAMTRGQFALVESFLVSHGAVIAKEKDGQFAYYSETKSSLKIEPLGSAMAPEECAAQLAHGTALFQKLGSEDLAVWCMPSEYSKEKVYMYVLNNASSMLVSDFGQTAPHSYSFEQCLSTRDLVLSDSRYDQFLGGICAPSVLDRGVYVLELFNKLY